MRITGGIPRGRPLKAPDGLEVRPTQDRVREALFNILMHDIAGARFLDLFAGCGSVGFEALSRGAASVVMVELDRRHVACIRDNAAKLKVEPEIVQGDAYQYVSAYSPARTAFDIVFADPPYVLGEENGYAKLLGELASRGVVRPGGLFIAEMVAHQHLETHAEWELCRDREYGKTRIALWRRKLPGEVG